MDLDSITELSPVKLEQAAARVESRLFRFKRAIDIALGLLFFLLTLPLMILIAVLVRLDSPGPALYRSGRIGRGGVRFKMWKFRTMVDCAEEALEQYLADNPAARAEWNLNQKLKNDPRVTRMGRVLRKLSLDELPQFWNILVGDMRLVGLSHRRRLSMKPGLTCLWQVRGRNKVRDFKEWVRLDLEYIDNWSIGLDIKLIVKTVGVVVLGRGSK